MAGKRQRRTAMRAPVILQMHIPVITAPQNQIAAPALYRHRPFPDAVRRADAIPFVAQAGIEDSPGVVAYTVSRRLL
jgi:hypothetical protein